MKYLIRYKKFAIKWLEKKRGFVKESTYANYACIIHNHIIPVLGNYYLRNISNELLQNFIIRKCQEGRLDNSGGLSDKAIKDIVSVLKSSIRYAIKNKYMKYIDLEFYYPSNNNNEKICVFSKLEQKRLIENASDNMKNKDIGIVLALYTGIRIGELCALRWGDIDFKRGYLNVDKTIQRIYVKDNMGVGRTKLIITSPKTKNAIRTIPINKEFIDVLKKVRKREECYILTGTRKCMEPRNLRKYYYKIIDKLEISRLHFHSLRHTFATNCIRLGCDYKTVSELLGHSSVNMTLNIYVHSQMSQKKRCINTMYHDLVPEIEKEYFDEEMDEC